MEKVKENACRPADLHGDLGSWPGDRCRPERDILRGLIRMQLLCLPVR